MPKQRSIAKSRLEALLSMATGAAAEPLAGIAGLYGLTQGGSQEAVRMIDKTRGKLTYQPRDPRGQQEIAAALGPIMQKVEAGKSWLGDKAYNASGSPALGAAAYTAPDALLAALGVRPAMAAGRAASGGVGRAVVRSQSLPAPAMGSPASQAGNIGHWLDSPGAWQMTREQFLGDPKITKNANAAELKPRALSVLDGVPPEPISVGGKTYLARYSPDGAAIFDGDKVIASYNFGDTLVVDKAYRKRGIGEELVYEWRTRHPAPATTRARTKASQAIQEKVWDRIQREGGGN